jgi:hypothetical protein
MLTLVGTTQHGAGSVQTTVILFAVLCVIFWRVILRITVMVAAVVLIALLLSGMIMLLQDIHSAG